MDSTNTSKERCQELHRASFEPIEVETGTKCTCTQHDLTMYHARLSALSDIIIEDIPAPIEPKKPIRWLANFLHQDNWPTPQVKEALERLMLAREDRQWGPDIIIKAAKDLDTAFFNSLLDYQISVRWSDPSETAALNKNFGMAQFLEVMMCDIYSNRDEVLLKSENPAGVMWGTMVHEMIVRDLASCLYETLSMTDAQLKHAFLFTHCCPSLPLENGALDIVNGWRTDHGWTFRWLINVIGKRTAESIGVHAHAEWENYELGIEGAEAIFPLCSRQKRGFK